MRLESEKCEMAVDREHFRNVQTFFTNHFSKCDMVKMHAFSRCDVCGNYNARLEGSETSFTVDRDVFNQTTAASLFNL